MFAMDYTTMLRHSDSLFMITFYSRLYPGPFSIIFIVFAIHPRTAKHTVTPKGMPVEMAIIGGLRVKAVMVMLVAVVYIVMAIGLLLVI